MHWHELYRTKTPTLVHINVSGIGFARTESRKHSVNMKLTKLHLFVQLRTSSMPSYRLYLVRPRLFNNVTLLQNLSFGNYKECRAVWKKFWIFFFSFPDFARWFIYIHEIVVIENTNIFIKRWNKKTDSFVRYKKNWTVLTFLIIFRILTILQHERLHFES